MSEDKTVQVNDDSKDNEIEQLKREKAAMEMKLRRSDEDLYSEEYLAFLQEQKNKPQQQNSFMSGGKLTDYSEDEMQNMPVSKLAKLMVGEVLSVVKGEENKKMTREEASKRKKKVADTRIEIKNFAKDHPDFWNYVDRIDELSNENPNLNTEQLYALAGGKVEEKTTVKQETKPKPPNTRATVEAGVKQSDKNLSRREIIRQEYQKLK